jgi:hypothetical protein
MSVIMTPHGSKIRRATAMWWRRYAYVTSVCGERADEKIGDVFDTFVYDLHKALGEKPDDVIV